MYLKIPPIIKLALYLLTYFLTLALLDCLLHFRFRYYTTYLNYLVNNYHHYVTPFYHPYHHYVNLQHQQVPKQF